MSKSIRILVVEDDKNLGILLKSFLAARNFSSVLCYDVDTAKGLFENEFFDMIITDIMLPGVNGYEFVKFVRSVDNEIPVVFLSGKSLQTDVIYGFELGADDYVTKPFNMEELMLRVEAIVKRAGIGKKSQNSFKIGTYFLDTKKHCLLREGKEYKLTTKELDLLHLLCENMGQVVARPVALKIVWNEDNYFSARNMDVYVGRLRNILCDDPNVNIENVHGVGYRLTDRC
ncbi:MAG: response regulator transcription factor [bacterium]|nr:response regulator transcription factor [Candidatus Limimorpha caballi]MCQ2315492.1 response regulator transcription factor [Bacteroidales bacterium]